MAMFDETSRTGDNQNSISTTVCTDVSHAAVLVGTGDSESSTSSDVVSASDLVASGRQPSNTDQSSVENAADYPMRITLSSMKAGYKARLKLYEMEGDQGWTVGERCDLMVGVSVKFVTPNPSVNLNSFSIGPHELSICVNQDCERIDICLYIRAKKSFLKGSVQLPQGGVATVESVVDRASLVGMSSFGIALY
ncbi:MAG TPA: hypothetical protein VHC91_12155 [Trinickia sp.]|uniref:hypothetical protein n=1 Tax=Trinickia sp. TaxID=2571163 RepID=UPI002CE83C77|nr:hypothetical protein [Trinickia sp.]HVW51129.1 hypothetical protein [Trinickia sp.]